MYLYMYRITSKSIYIYICTYCNQIHMHFSLIPTNWKRRTFVALQKSVTRDCWRLGISSQPKCCWDDVVGLHPKYPKTLLQPSRQRGDWSSVATGFESGLGSLGDVHHSWATRNTQWTENSPWNSICPWIVICYSHWDAHQKCCTLQSDVFLHFKMPNL